RAISSVDPVISSPVTVNSPRACPFRFVQIKVRALPSTIPSTGPPGLLSGVPVILISPVTFAPDCCSVTHASPDPLPGMVHDPVHLPVTSTAGGRTEAAGLGAHPKLTSAKITSNRKPIVNVSVLRRHTRGKGRGGKSGRNRIHARALLTGWARV